MKWSEGTTWEMMLDWCTRLHDGTYPTSSPSCAPKLVGCSKPSDRCKALAIWIDHDGRKGLCSMPHLECEHRIFDYKEGHTPQISKEAKSPGVKTDSAQAILAWVALTLRDITQSEMPEGVRRYASSLLSDSDYSTDHDTLQTLGTEILRRLKEDRPWQRKGDTGNLAQSAASKPSG